MGPKVTNAILVIIIISFAFSLFFNNGPKKENIPISQLASDISLGLVKEISVSGDNLDITYNAFGTSTPVVKTSLRRIGLPTGQSAPPHGIWNFTASKSQSKM